MAANSDLKRRTGRASAAWEGLSGAGCLRCLLSDKARILLLPDMQRHISDEMFPAKGAEPLLAPRMFREPQIMRRGASACEELPQGLEMGPGSLPVS